jgi:hypothetical protein
MFEFSSHKNCIPAIPSRTILPKRIGYNLFSGRFLSTSIRRRNSKMFFWFPCCKLLRLHDILLILKCIFILYLYLMRANTNQFLPDVQNSSSKPFNSLKTLLLKNMHTCPKKSLCCHCTGQGRFDGVKYTYDNTDTKLI